MLLLMCSVDVKYRMKIKEEIKSVTFFQCFLEYPVEIYVCILVLITSFYPQPLLKPQNPLKNGHTFKPCLKYPPPPPILELFAIACRPIDRSEAIFKDLFLQIIL